MLAHPTLQTVTFTTNGPFVIGSPSGAESVPPVCVFQRPYNAMSTSRPERLCQAWLCTLLHNRRDETSVMPGPLQILTDYPRRACTFLMERICFSHL
jgi:hypothetical protein